MFKRKKPPQIERRNELYRYTITYTDGKQEGFIGEWLMRDSLNSITINNVGGDEHRRITLAPNTWARYESEILRCPKCHRPIISAAEELRLPCQTCPCVYGGTCDV